MVARVVDSIAIGCMASLLTLCACFGPFSDSVETSRLAPRLPGDRIAGRNAWAAYTRSRGATCDLASVEIPGLLLLAPVQAAPLAPHLVSATNSVAAAPWPTDWLLCTSQPAPDCRRRWPSTTPFPPCPGSYCSTGGARWSVLAIPNPAPYSSAARRWRESPPLGDRVW